MNSHEVITSLSVIQNRCSSLLLPSSKTVLQQAQAEVRSSFQTYQSSLRGGARRSEAPPTWGYEIRWDNPLIFKARNVRGFTLQVDLFCKVRWGDPEARPHTNNLVLRVWALDSHVSYRPEWDSPSLEAVGAKRVMLRYHFDQANEGQSGPLFHVQAGGNARTEEYCWLHEGISLPRLAHPPLDIVLASEMVLANFMGTEAANVVEDPTWIGAIRQSQRSFLFPYYQLCLEALNAEQSLLKSLWVQDKWLA